MPNRQIRWPMATGNGEVKTLLSPIFAQILVQSALFQDKKCEYPWESFELVFIKARIAAQREEVWLWVTIWETQRKR
jgi:hypothetical protein